MKRSNAHQIYRLADGTRVPGCTSIVGVMDKPALVGWANRLGLEGTDVVSYVDALAAAGTLAHYLVECELSGKEPERAYVDEFSKADMDNASSSVEKFREWHRSHDVRVLGTEMQLVSEEHRFGGTCDVYAEVDGVPTLVDLKTCKALYGATDEKWTQLAGYHLLLEESGHRVERDFILRVGRTPGEGFEYVEMPMRELHIRRFLLCRELYAVNAQLR